MGVREASRVDWEVVNSQPVSGPISSAWSAMKAANILHGERAWEDPGWDFCPAKGFLLLKCFTAPTFLSNLEVVVELLGNEQLQGRGLSEAKLIDTDVFGYRL